MMYSSACPDCGEALSSDDARCPRCGGRRRDPVLASAPVRGATRALAATTGETPPVSSPEPTPAPAPVEDFDGWQEVRLQLEEATRGEFEIVKELGRGGMAAVYLARDLALGRNVAIKVMAPGLLLGPGMVDRFRQEAVTIANLHHPNIVTIHTVRQAGPLHFFVMQVVDGGSLEDILARPEPIPIYLAQAILYQLGVGLAYAHRRGVVHRDIKPANVLLDTEGNAILTDFGIAKVTTGSNLTQTGSTIGTPAYMSPEQCLARELSGASDQYSLGVVAYEMLTGDPPFAGSPFEIMQSHTATPLSSIRDKRPDCPPELEAAVLRMLAKEPEGRFADVAEAIEAIGGYLPGPQDPIRVELARLVTLGAGASLAGREPLRPTPGRAATPAPPTRTASPGSKGGLRSRLPLWVTGAVALATIVTVGVLSFQASPSEENPEPVPPPALPVSSITFPNPLEEILVGATLRVRADLQDSEGTALTEQVVSWASGDPGVATVEGFNEEAVVTGVGPGSAAIRASSGGVEEGFEVVVSAPAAGELNVTSPSREILVGSQLGLSAILTDAAGGRVTDPEVVWSSSDSRVLEVDSRSGMARGIAMGRAQVTATSGDQTGTVTLNVVGRVDALTLDAPAGPLQAGGTAVVRSTVTSRPAGYLGTDGVRWTSSNPSVAAVSFAGADSVVLTLLGSGETVLTARADAVQEAITLRIGDRPQAVTLNLSSESVAFQGVEGGSSPGEQTIEVTATGGATPTVGGVQYGNAGAGWLTPSLETRSPQVAVLTLRAELAGLTEGAYTATVPVGAGGETRVVSVRLTVAENPAAAAVEPTAAAAQEIATLLSEYASAINAKNTTRVREIFPSLPQAAIDDLLGLRETDTYLLQLVPGSLRLGEREQTLEGDVMSSVLGRGNRGEAVRMIYAFGRGAAGGWYVVSLRSGG